MGSGFKKGFFIIHMYKELLFRFMLSAKKLGQNNKELNKVTWIFIKRKKTSY